jgi:hypothetical protein
MNNKQFSPLTTVPITRAFSFSARRSQYRVLRAENGVEGLKSHAAKRLL